MNIPFYRRPVTSEPIAAQEPRLYIINTNRKIASSQHKQASSSQRSTHAPPSYEEGNLTFKIISSVVARSIIFYVLSHRASIKNLSLSQ